MMGSPPSSSEPSRGFDLLAEPVRRWVWDKGWQSLRDIQERAIPLLVNGENDVIITAATAGGKTEAAFLPLISQVLERPGSGGFDLLYVGPLRALINDQFGRVEDLCQRTELPVFPWHGDISQGVKSRARENPRGVLLITPESLEALFVRRGLEIPTLFAGTRAVVVDELHTLLDSERGIHLRSLLTRLEVALGRGIRRVGLSATLGNMEQAREYLRPGSPENVVVLESRSDSQELQVQLRGYVRDGGLREDPDSEAEGTGAEHAVAKHLFSRLRGTSNLVFAGSRSSVEWYADKLRSISEDERVPLEFFPHHASLSRDHRTDLERRLKDGRPTTAVCTSTLELGIDIGEITCVGQIGPPFSVASLRQRLGRSGRRAGQPSVLRMYAVETDPDAEAHPLDRLYLGLIRSIAMIELLIENWCEPPASQALHLSTLTHQVLSVIAEHNGARADLLYRVLCERGPFRRVTEGLFVSLLRQLGRDDVALIEQDSEGTLLLGRRGERLVEHYQFYAVFQTPEEYRIVADRKLLGTLPVVMILTVGMTIIFAGRRWRVLSIHEDEKLIEVTADRVGLPPPFGGGAGVIHDRVVEKMMEVLKGTATPAYLDATAVRLLEHARGEFRRLDVSRNPVATIDTLSSLIATSTGTVKTATLALVLRAKGYRVDVYDGFLDVRREGELPSVEGALEAISASDPATLEDFVADGKNLIVEKFHRYLSPALLVADAVSSRLDFGSLPKLTRKLYAAR